MHPYRSLQLEVYVTLGTLAAMRASYSTNAAGRVRSQQGVAAHIWRRRVLPICAALKTESRTDKLRTLLKQPGILQVGGTHRDHHAPARSRTRTPWDEPAHPFGQQSSTFSIAAPPCGEPSRTLLG